ncbi:uncharacterized protein LOC133884326 [Phragmites australis]|uniref:uncharacterized protein LOC133884326 n=1 Tax=Phragmites australis TaxID=29695 RepID=UPI002D797440|nr:uncharacterized protein LOC133884326 [Phragmites australis]
MRQFGRHQAFPLVPIRTVPLHVHRYTRKGQPAGHLWADRLAPYVATWAQALQDVVDEARPHTEGNFREYLRWYVPRTRTRVTYTPDDVRGHIASTTETYPVHWDEDAALAVSNFLKSVLHIE